MYSLGSSGAVAGSKGFNKIVLSKGSPAIKFHEWKIYRGKA